MERSNRPGRLIPFRLFITLRFTVSARVLENFLAIQDANGFIDWKPGLGGQRSHILTTPLLATLAQRIYEINQDRPFLETVFEPLLRSFHYWFNNSRDVDKDKIPEWEHLLQTGMDDHPKYAPWSANSDGLDIATVKSPALIALLFKEGQILAEFAQILAKESDRSDVLQTTQFLKKQIKKFYNPVKHSYSDRDRDAHTSPDGLVLFSNSGNGKFICRQKITPKARLIISVINDGTHICRPKIRIHGKDFKRKTLLLEFRPQQFKWYLGRGVCTTQEIFSFIQYISIEGVESTDLVSVQTADFCFTDITQFLPLWAGILDQSTADEIINSFLQAPGKYQSEFGIKAFDDESNKNLDKYAIIHPVWMTFILEGLLNYGYRNDAALLMTRYIQLIIRQLRSEKSFRHTYQATTGSGQGEKNHLHGIIPIDCFLRILGLKFLGEFQVRNRRT